MLTESRPARPTTSDHQDDGDQSRETIDLEAERALEARLLELSQKVQMQTGTRMSSVRRLIALGSMLIPNIIIVWQFNRPISGEGAALQGSFLKGFLVLSVAAFTVEMLRPGVTIEEYVRSLVGLLERWLWRPCERLWRRIAKSVQPKALQRLAADQSLEIGSFRFVTLRLQGTRGELEIEISARKWQSFSVVVGPQGIPNSLKLEKRSHSGADLRTGDDDFDNAVSVGDDDAIALALLDHETRRKVRDLIERGGAVADARIRLVESLPGQGLVELARSGSQSLEFLIELAERLEIKGSELAERMARNALEDPQEAVRIRNLKGLSRNFPLDSECVRVHRISLDAPAAALRLVAADFLMITPEIDLAVAGQAAQAMARLAQSYEEPDELRVRAIECLADKRFRDLAEPILRQELESATGAVLIAAIRGLAELEARESIPKMVELAREAEADRAMALAQALGKLGDIAAQPALLELLKRDDAEVVREAARALGQVGGVEAVEPLLERERQLADRSVARVTQEAVRRIQGRLTGAEAGQLTLAASGEWAGALSQAEDRAGRGDVSVVIAELPEAFPLNPSRARASASH